MQPLGDVQSEASADVGSSISDDEENAENIINDEADEQCSHALKEKIDIVTRFVFFDFETVQQDIYDETKLGFEYVHRPNLCVVRVICDDCRNRDFSTVCGRCGVSERVFEGETCVNDFCRFLFNKKMKNTVAIAHNAKGFDAHFIMQYLTENAIAPNVIARGKYLND